MSQPVLARLGFAALVLAALVSLAAVAGVRLGLMPYAQGWRLMFPATGLGLVALLLGLAWLVRALKRNDGAGRGLGLTAFVGALLLLYPPLSTYARRLTSPPIHDFTTDTENPPRFVALAGNGAHFDAAAMIDYRGEHNSVSYMLHEYYSGLTKPLIPIMVTKNPTGKMFWRAFNVAKRKGWRIVDFSEKEGRIEAVATSFWFGQPSDIVVRVRPAGTMGARFDVRVTSEKDAPDFGRNLDLIKTYRVELNS